MNVIVNSMNNIGNNNYTYNITLTNKITIQSDMITGFFSLDFSSGNNIKDILGFEQKIYSNNNNYTSINNWNLDPNYLVKITIENLDSSKNTICKFGNFNTKKSTTIELLRNQTRRIDSLQITLKNLDDSFYNTNGLEHSIFIILKYLR